MNGALLPSAREYFRCYGLSPAMLALARPDAIVMHPGPMNRGVEIDSDVADGPQAVILPQVTFGIAVPHGSHGHPGGELSNEQATPPYPERPPDRPAQRRR
jgi:hypothetical protein